MRRNLIALLPLAFAACVVQRGPDNNYVQRHQGPHSVKFMVTFAGATCDVATEVNSVRVQMQDPIGGDVDEEFPCGDVLVPGFVDGSYPYEITAYDGNGLAIYGAAGNAVVAGANVTLAIDLTPESGQGTLDFAWIFGQDALRCADVGATDMLVTLGAISTSVPCSPESPVEGHAFGVPPGSYTWSLSTTGASGRIWTASGGPVQVAPGADVQITATMQPQEVPTTGTLLITWTFAGSASCARSQEVDHLYVDIYSGNTKVVDHQSVPCLPGGAQVDLDPGSYTVDLAGYNGIEQRLYEASEVPATVTVGETTKLKVDLQAL